MSDDENKPVEPTRPTYPRPPLWLLIPSYTLLAVFIVVVLVALARKELDATGVALAILSLIGGGLGGWFVRQGGSK